STNPSPPMISPLSLHDALPISKGPIPAEQRWLYELIKINLAEDVNDRYFTCREFKTDLERRRLTREAPCLKCQAVNPVRQPYCRDRKSTRLNSSHQIISYAVFC